MKVTKQKAVETALNLAFNKEQIADAVVLMGEWIEEEKAKDFSTDLPTDFHKDVMEHMHYMLMGYIDIGEEDKLLFIKHMIRNVIIELDAFLVQVEKVNVILDNLADITKGDEDASTD